MCAKHLMDKIQKYICSDPLLSKRMLVTRTETNSVTGHSCIVDKTKHITQNEVSASLPIYLEGFFMDKPYPLYRMHSTVLPETSLLFKTILFRFIPCICDIHTKILVQNNLFVLKTLRNKLWLKGKPFQKLSLTINCLSRQPGHIYKDNLRFRKDSKKNTHTVASVGGDRWFSRCFAYWVRIQKQPDLLFDAKKRGDQREEIRATVEINGKCNTKHKV